MAETKPEFDGPDEKLMGHCRSCRQPISKKADVCQNCGHVYRKPVGVWAITLGAFLGAAVIPFIISQLWVMFEYMSSPL
ncbi:hypothetical protein [Litorimonas sp. WD9-15]|uniref:hypothetical protein n=1 Tax=Litorimonas sp. WD9-15 TaxID=3418716 RepID=UPI003D006A3F